MLKYPPTPEYAPQHAALCVEAVKNISKTDLDYSVDSLQLVDDAIEKFRCDGVTSEQIGETLFTFGCYVGEVIVRHAGGKWLNAADTQRSHDWGFPMVLQFESEVTANPIGKVFKRLENGKEDNLPFFYQVLYRHTHEAMG